MSIVAIVFLLLPVLYVGSYLALVQPAPDWSAFRSPGRDIWPYRSYRLGGKAAQQFFWPLEQIDRKLRPEPWDHYPGQYVI